jgi:hypothetical protein
LTDVQNSEKVILTKAYFSVFGCKVTKKLAHMQNFLYFCADFIKTET